MDFARAAGGTMTTPCMSRILALAGAFVEGIKVNEMTQSERNGRTVWIKRRRWTAEPVLACANRFFRLAGAPLQAIHHVAAWQRWEIECFHRLHAPEYRAFQDGPRAIGADAVPGVNLTGALDNGTITPGMTAAAGRELRRAHTCECPELGGAYSHGDPHLGNFVYETATERARLIDFEVIHHAALPATERHADDLLVFLQDMVGRIRDHQWLPCARAFLDGYARPEIAALLPPRLVIPRGIARLWWAVRTTFLPRAELQRRLSALVDLRLR